jgi:hypothetical protein
VARSGTAPVQIPELSKGRGRRRLLFLTGLSLALSASTLARVEVAGLLFQPVVIPAVILFIATGGKCVQRIPRRINGTLIAFVAVFCAVTLFAGFSFGELAKIGLFWLLIVVFAGSIDDADDARSAALGFALSMGLVSLHALALGPSGDKGINPFAGVSNDNGFSVYALPALLLAGHYLLDKETPQRQRIIFTLCAGAILVATFSTPNRSGFVGVIAVVLLLVARGRSARDVVAITVLGIVMYWGFTTFGDQSALDFELHGDEKKQSDLDSRREILQGAVEVGFEQPLTGVGPQNVPEALGAHMAGSDKVIKGRLEPHNVIGYVAAGGALPLFLVSVALALALWTRPAEWVALGPPDDEEKAARGLLRIVLMLFIIRGMFTHEVLTTPSFPIAIGIALGLNIACRPRLAKSADPHPLGDEAPPRATPARRVGYGRLTHPRGLVAFDPWAPARSVDG